MARTWYDAVAYCNWLSEQEGLPKEEWCYLRNASGAYADGMSIPADVLERTGYRLPTEAEWEYACRAGTVTSRYYGHSPALIDSYAWYVDNSQDHAWTCGSLRPNDLGLFDMLGNMIEWFHDNSSASRAAKHGLYNDVVNMSKRVNEQDPPLLGGGGFDIQSVKARSAIRYKAPPGVQSLGRWLPPFQNSPLIDRARIRRERAITALVYRTTVSRVSLSTGANERWDANRRSATSIPCPR